MMMQFLQDPQMMEAFSVMYNTDFNKMGQQPGNPQQPSDNNPGPGWEDISPKSEPKEE